VKVLRIDNKFLLSFRLGTSSLHQNYFTINEFEFSCCCLSSCIGRERLIGCSLDNDPISLVVTGCINVGLISLVMVSLG
jgi:hypothetical protein